MTGRKPKARLTRDEMREALADSWASAVAVAESIKAQHPKVYERECKLAVRTLTTALLILDRAVGTLPR